MLSSFILALNLDFFTNSGLSCLLYDKLSEKVAGLALNVAWDADIVQDSETFDIESNPIAWWVN